MAIALNITHACNRIIVVWYSRWERRQYTQTKKITSTKFDIEQRTMNNLGAISKPKCEMRVKKLKIFEANWWWAHFIWIHATSDFIKNDHMHWNYIKRIFSAKYGGSWNKWCVPSICHLVHTISFGCIVHDGCMHLMRYHVFFPSVHWSLLEI